MFIARIHVDVCDHSTNRDHGWVSPGGLGTRAGELLIPPEPASVAWAWESWPWPLTALGGLPRPPHSPPAGYYNRRAGTASFVWESWSLWHGNWKTGPEPSLIGPVPVEAQTDQLSYHWSPYPGFEMTHSNIYPIYLLELVKGPILWNHSKAAPRFWATAGLR